ncbi:lymphocyte activation gene 3 protein [Sparus aurata]|uniref:Ig-like domain-containing protein n=1 Tax=Sparus aurata TaxID=8175 RepID=A0A671WJZ6_SPAAU|nr:lymphocyte activation gene 3 protein [Sparus aurata]
MLSECFIFGVITFLTAGAQCQDTEVFAEAGSQALLPCRYSSSSTVAPAIMWNKVNKGTVWRKEKNGLQYRGSSWTQRAKCPHSQFERGDFSLQLNNVTEQDGGIYTCRVVGEHRVTESRIMLIIIKVSVSPSVPMLGSDVSIGCKVTPEPHGVTVRWMLNNRPFRTAESVVNVKASVRVTGNWTCVVGYEGKEGRASATLAVKGIIQPSKDDAKVYAAVGSAITLPCVFTPGLFPAKPALEKLKPGSLLIHTPDRLPASFVASSPSSEPTSDHSATLKEVEFEDQGTYRCSGIIKGHWLTRNMQLVVAKIDSSTLSKKRDSLTLTCQLTDTSEVVDYEWVHVVYDVNGTQSVESIQKGKTLSLDKVSEENQGEWTCRFYGEEGILGNVTHHVHLMGGLSGKKSSSVSNNTVATVGLSILLLVLLLVLVKMYLNHQRRKRILQYPALETIVHTTSNEREERERNREKK